jgi:hypothetical protein
MGANNDSPEDRIAELPDQARRDLDEFLRKSARPFGGPEDLAEELRDSLALKEILSAPPLA